MADPETYTKMLERLNAENASRPFQEFPKMLYHPDGRQATVNSSAEESTLLGSDWCKLPGDALKVRAERDEADKARDASGAAKAKKDKG